MLRELLQTPDDRAALVARIGLGLMIAAHGAQKVLGWFDGPGIDGALGFYASLGIPPALGWIAMLTEFLGGIALLVGFLGRVAALGIAVDLCVAVAKVHWQVGFFMNWTGRQSGEGFEFFLLAVSLAVIVLIRGSGAFSMDRALTVRRAAA